MSRTLIHNAVLVLPDEVVENGSLLIAGACIEAVCPRAPDADRHVDAAGRVLMPGMIDLHTDAIEAEIEPRPGVRLPAAFAISQIDQRSAALGLTTVYHSLSFSGEELGLRSDALAAALARDIHDFGPNGCIDNRVHARYEITNHAAIPVLESLLDRDAIALLSLMDHTPGQGQFQTIESYHRYLVKRYAHDAEALEIVIARKLEAVDGAWERASRLIRRARDRAVPLASHDDDSRERVAAMLELGVSICEFPVNDEAGAAIRDAGRHALVGSPNVFRGGSQSSGMRAVDAIGASYADCLCSDYVPSTMLPAVWRVRRELGYSLPRAVALATRNPAAAARLADRGIIADGRRADLILVRDDGPYPRVTRTWSRGRCVFASAP